MGDLEKSEERKEKSEEWRVQKEKAVYATFLFGGGEVVKAEHRRRGMRLGIAPYSPDDWGRQLAAGGDEENWTPVRKSIHTTFFADSLLFWFPVKGR